MFKEVEKTDGEHELFSVSARNGFIFYIAPNVASFLFIAFSYCHFAGHEKTSSVSLLSPRYPTIIISSS
jgi:hypothetical protein